MFTIRDATDKDLPAIIEIYNQSIQAGRSTADTSPITVADRVEWFRQFDPAKRPIWVAEHEGRIAGCIYLTRVFHRRPAYDKTAEISTYIATAYQRKGLGALLKQKMIEACPGLGVENLISMYFDHNEATKKLNEKFGFQVAGHLPEIADVLGQKRGLMIALLRVGKAAPGSPPTGAPRGS
jgi:L-amino acid N-acyltransferase YncA